MSPFLRKSLYDHLGADAPVSRLRLHRGPNLNALLPPLLDLLENGSDLFAPKPLIVAPTPEVAEWLKCAIAKEKSLCLGIHPLLPSQFIGMLWRKISAEGCTLLLEEKEIALLLYKHLEVLLDPPRVSPPFEELHVSLRSLSLLSRQKRLVELAERVGELFSYVGSAAPEISQRWESAPPDATWLTALWFRLFGPQADHCSLLQFREDLMQVGKTLDPLHLLFVGPLSSLGGIRFLLEPLSLLLKIDYFLPSFAFEETQENSSKVSQDFRELWPYPLLPTETIDYEETSPRLPSLLSALRLTFQGKCPSIQEELWTDDSLQFHKCSGAREELAVLKKELLSLMREDPTLDLTEIGITSPQLSLYLPFIQMLFPSIGEKAPQPDHLEVGQWQISPYQAAFTFLLDLPLGNFSVEELAPLWENPCVQKERGFSSQEGASFAALARSLDVRGKASKIGTREGSWEWAADRILLGIAWGEEEGPFKCLSFSDRQELAGHGKLLQLTLFLLREISSWEKERHSLKKWSQLLLFLLEQVLSPESQESAACHQHIRQTLIGMKFSKTPFSSFEDPHLPFILFRHHCLRLLQPEHAFTEESRGIRILPFSAAQVLPVRVLCVVGMGEEVSLGSKEWGLSRDALGSVSSPSRLPELGNLLLSGQEKILFFFSSQTPSIALERLFTSIEKSLSPPKDFLQRLTKDHPLQPCFIRYVQTISQESAQQPPALLPPEKKRCREKPAPEEEITLSSISFSQLTLFLASPIESYLIDGLGLSKEGLQAPSPTKQVQEFLSLSPESRRRCALSSLLLGSHPPPPPAQQLLREEILLGKLSQFAFLPRELTLLEANAHKRSELLEKWEIDLRSFEAVRLALLPQKEALFPFLPSLPFCTPSTALTGSLPELGRNLEDPSLFLLLSYNPYSTSSPYHQIRGMVLALVLSSLTSLLPFSQLKVVSVGEKWAWELFFEPIDHSSLILKDLLNLYSMNLQDPLPLFRDLGSLWKLGSPALREEKLKNLWLNYSQECARQERSPSSLNLCTASLFPSSPPIPTKTIEALLEKTYGLIQKSGKFVPSPR